MSGKNYELEHKDFKFEIKADTLQDDGSFEGYASVFGNIDSYNDKIEAGAFTKTLRESKQFPMLWSHDVWSPPIGIITAKQDDHGLLVKGSLNLNVARAIEIYELLKQKALNGLSIGFNSIKFGFIEKANQMIRVISEIKLWEISIVIFPANAKAQINDVKSFDPLIEHIKLFKDNNDFRNKLLSILELDPAKTSHAKMIEAVPAQPGSPGKHIESLNKIMEVLKK